MQVCEAGSTLAQRCVVVCDVRLSGAYTMNNLSYLCCICTHFYITDSVRSWVHISSTLNTFLSTLNGKKYYRI